MNLLRSGSRLTMPGESELTAISPGEASAEIHKQYSEWNQAHAGGTAANAGSANAGGAGQLHLVPPQESAAKSAAASPSASAAAAPSTGPVSAAASGAGNAAAGAAMQARVSQLESQLADSQRMLQMKNAELAALQARPAQTPAAAAPSAPTPAPTPAPSANAPAATPTPAPPAAAPAPPPAAAAAPSPPPAAKPTKPAAPAAGTSFTDLLVQYWYVPAALVVVLIVLLVMRAVRARQEDAFDRSLGRLSGLESRPEELRTTDTVPVRALAPAREETAYRVEESGAHEQPPGAAAALADTAASGQHVAIDENVPAEAPVALDQGDPLAEADFHMAYGLYDQAADLVQIAISREPERRDLRLKLLEVFFVWGNKDRFLQTARELAATRDKALPGEWEKIVIMGRQIAPEDPLFASGAALSGAASGGVDLNLEGGQNRIDFDLMGEPTVGAPPGGSSSGVDLDLGAALGDTAASDSDPTGEARPISESGVDFVFDDADRGNEQTGSTREMPSRSGQATTMTAAIANEADAPTVEQPQLPQAGDHPTIRQKIDAAKRGGAVQAEQTAELELHDLGLDLGAMETAGDETEIAPSPDGPTMLAGTGDETRQMLHQADDERGKADRAHTPGEPTDSGTWLFTDTDFVDVATAPGRGADAPTEIVTQLAPRPDIEAPPDAGSTARLQAIESAGLDLDLGDLDKTQIRDLGSMAGNGVDLDVGAPPSTSASEGTFVQTQRIMAEDIPLPDLEPATMSEVGTKLDLARAYMDMGDPEGARSILSEVLSEGSVSQKQEARRLMDTLPG
jgi:pilus assembly protein FimV